MIVLIADAAQNALGKEYQSVTEGLVLVLTMSAATAGEFRDPMRPVGAAPAVTRAAANPSLKLEGVIGGARRVAIVNGRVVRAGDSIGGARILEVFSNGVRCERAGKIFTLTLPVVHATSTVRVARSPEASAP